MQQAFNQIMEFNKLDITIIIITIIQLTIGFTQGYKKTLYHSLKYVLAYIITRGTYNLFMPQILETNLYLGYQNWIEQTLKQILPTNFSIIQLYPVDRYLLNIILFISVLVFLRLLIIGWAPQTTLFDRFAGMIIAIAKVIIITTILVLLLNPFTQMLEPILNGNIIEQSIIINNLKKYNPLLNNSQIEF